MLDRNTSLGLISALALTVALGCASKKSDSGEGGTGGGGFCVGSSCGNAGASSTGGASGLPADYCNGLLTGATCSQTNLQADVREVDMMLVIDQSGSMQDPPSATSASTKWSEMTTALSGALPAFASTINFGLVLYPFKDGGLDRSTPEGSCAVEIGTNTFDVNVGIAPGNANLDSIINTVRTSAPAGGTPTAKALSKAYAYFTQGAGKSLTGKKYVLLATDGGPNCDTTIQCAKETCTQNLDGKCGGGVTATINCCDTTSAAGQAAKANISCLDEAGVVKQIQQLKQAGVITYVIGIPGSEAYATTLDHMADAGGAPNTAATNGHTYYEVSATNSLADLQAALNTIITQLVKTCDIELKSTPSNSKAVTAVKDCLRIPALPDNKPPVPGTGVQDGFYIDYNYTTTPAHLVLTGTYCDSIMSLGAERLDIIEGCILPD